MDDDDIDNDDDNDIYLAPAVCQFCGELTSAGLMVFPNERDVWPVCKLCMQAAFTRRRDRGRLELCYRRSPN